MSMTLLQIVAEFCRRTGLTVPTKVFDSNDETVLQIAALANEGCEDLGTRAAWSAMLYSAEWTSVADESQGLVTDLADTGFRSIQNQTIFDRTTRLPIYGPLDQPEYQYLKALPNTGPLYRYLIMQGELRIMPEMEAGHEMAFSYTSEALVQETGGGDVKQYFTADTDEFLLPDKLMLRYLRWRWKAEKGFPYTEEFNGYERVVADFKAGDGTKKVLDMDATQGQIRPGVFVPSGNWNLP